MSEEIKLTREVEAIAIPAGTAKKLPTGTEVIITQELGGTFTVHTPHEGGLFRIQGKDNGWFIIFFSFNFHATYIFF